MLYRCVAGEHQSPFAEYENLQLPLQVVLHVASKNLRPTIPDVDEAYLPFVELIKACWDQDPDQRPDIKKVLEKLQEYQKIAEEQESKSIKLQNSKDDLVAENLEDKKNQDNQ